MDDEQWMTTAISVADTARSRTSPNPWVGAVVVAGSGQLLSRGATEPPGGRHAEVVALDEAGDRARGATLFVTLEPCSHHGRTGPCVEAVEAAGVARVVVGISDPDQRVAGRGLEQLRAAGIEVVVGTCADQVTAQLAPYLHHRRTGRPYVVLKLASTLDGRTAAPDGTSQWITGEAARRDAHLIRAHSDAVVVGAGTVRADDPALTVRLVPGRDPLRVVLGCAPAHAKVHPCREYSGELEPLLDDLGAQGILQVMVEGGATVARAFHAQGLVDRYVFYFAPALFGGDDARGLFAGPGAPTISELRTLDLTEVIRLGSDLRIDALPKREDPLP
jgi:diaminohydroxyphosphoribosylaminopyrimidine deaminase/5-amino-6-(5-phosphoribosylamino)uracil reductase